MLTIFPIMEATKVKIAPFIDKYSLFMHILFRSKKIYLTNLGEQIAVFDFEEA